jgi:hypothetical protein
MVLRDDGDGVKKWTVYDRVKHFGHVVIHETGEQYQRRLAVEAAADARAAERKRKRK